MIRVLIDSNLLACTIMVRMIGKKYRNRLLLNHPQDRRCATTAKYPFVFHKIVVAAETVLNQFTALA